MSDEQNEQVDKTDIITPAERRNIWIWANTLVVLFAAATVLTAWAVYSNKIASIKQHSDRMNPEVGEGRTEPPPTDPPAGANHVRAGIYVSSPQTLSHRDGEFLLRFTIQ
jgi:hypothetical protein